MLTKTGQINWQETLAQITRDYKIKHLGTFDTEEGAALAYNRAAKKLHGKYAFINKI